MWAEIIASIQAINHDLTCFLPTYINIGKKEQVSFIYIFIMFSHSTCGNDDRLPFDYYKCCILGLPYYYIELWNSFICQNTDNQFTEYLWTQQITFPNQRPFHVYPGRHLWLVEFRLNFLTTLQEKKIVQSATFLSDTWPHWASWGEYYLIYW